MHDAITGEFYTVGHLPELQFVVTRMLTQWHDLFVSRSKKTRSSADADKPARRVCRSAKVTKIVPFDVVGIVSHCAIVTLSLRRAVFTIFDFIKCRDLEIGVKSHSRLLRVISFDRWFPISVL